MELVRVEQEANFDKKLCEMESIRSPCRCGYTVVKICLGEMPFTEIMVDMT